MEREESRYAHLLAPIRDLAQNWHTDIAAELSDYLSQLEELTFTFDGGDTNLNFAEAALLIQGSTCVYSRKVEYLHKLVFNALEAVATKRRAANGQDAGQADDDFDDTDVDTFLALDDVLQEGDAIDLDETAAARTAVTPKGGDAAFWALRDAARSAGAEAGNAAAHTAFQVASCAVHFTGALLLDPRDAALLDEHLQYTQPEAALPAVAVAEYDDDFGGGGGGGGWSDDDAGHLVDAAVPQGTPGRGAQHGARAAAADEDDGEDEPDPWAPLDFDDPNGLPVRPFRKGKMHNRAPAPPGGVCAAKARAELETRAAHRLGAVFPEFAYGHEACAKKRQRDARTAAASARSRGAPVPAAVAEGAAAGFDDAYDDYGGFGGGGMSDDDFGMPPPLEGADLDALEAAAAAGVALPALGDLAGRAGMHAPSAAGEEEPSYEDLVRAHVERYMAAAAAAETQTELAARVASWKAKIEPTLQEQEARPLFDIHALGAQVMASIQQAAPMPDTPDAPAPRVRFDDFMHDSPAYEVARAFAATLQLVNAGNVRVLEAATGDDGAGHFSLELLQITSANNALDQYLAPSQQGMERPKAAKKSGKADAPAAKRRAALAASQDK